MRLLHCPTPCLDHLHAEPCAHCFAAPLYLCCTGNPHPDRRTARGLAHAHRYLSGNPHTGDRRDLAVHRLAAGPDGRSDHFAFRTGADHHGQRHPPYRGAVDDRLRDRQGVLPARGQYQYRQRATDFGVPGHPAQPAAGHGAAADPQLQRLDGADRAIGAVGQWFQRAETGRPGPQHRAIDADHGSRRGRALPVRRQEPPGADRPGLGADAGAGAFGAGCRHGPGDAERDHPGGHAEDRQL